MTLESLAQDLKFGARMLRRSPSFFAFAVITLAVGIGANTAVFSIFEQVLLRQLPVPEPDRLVILRSPVSRPGHTWSDGSDEESFAFPDYLTLRDGNNVFSGLAATHPVEVSAAVRGQPEIVSAELVSGNYFETLGVSPALGRLLTPGDDQIGKENPVVVLSYDYWKSAMGSDPSILNQRVLINDQPMTVVGITRGGFSGDQVGQTPSFFIPISLKPKITPNWNGLDDYNDYWVHMLGRLKPGASRDQAQAQLQVLFHQVLQEHERHFRSPRSAQYIQKYESAGIFLDSGAKGRQVFQRDAREPLLLLVGMAGLVLLIAVTNVANMLVARGMARGREFSIRTALGAGRTRLVAQSLVETWIVFMAGALLALICAQWLTALLLASIPSDQATGLSAALNGKLLLFHFLIAFAAGTLAGLAPAFRSSRQNIAGSMTDQGRASTSGSSTVRFRQALIAAEIALTLVLLTGAGLFVRSLQNLRHVDLGLDPDQVTSFALDPKLNGYSPQQTAALFADLRQRLSSAPGITSVSLAEIPAFANSESTSNFSFQGYTAAPDEDTHIQENRIGPQFFATMGVPLISGREFSESDVLSAPKRAIISQSTARKYFAGNDPVGSHIGLGSGPSTKLDIEVVGVVADSRFSSVRGDPQRFIYFPFAQDEKIGSATFYLRTSLPFEQSAALVRNTVRAVDPALPIKDLITVRSQINLSLYAERLERDLSLTFGLIAILLAAIGIYGLLAYAVTQRTREIGVRMALGAKRSQILGMVLRQGILLIALGVVFGLPLIFAGSRATASVLYAVSGIDPLAIAGAIVLLCLIGLLASYIPARRASNVDPMEALRYE